MAEALPGINATTPFSFEEAWDNTINRVGAPAFVILGTFIVHEIFYFGRYIPFYFCDYIPALRKYKIQADKENKPEVIWRIFWKMMLIHVFVELPMMSFFHLGVEWLGLKLFSPFPPMWKMLVQAIIFLIIEDFYEYWGHRLLHFGWFYKYIHKQHHEHTAPFGLVAEYAHPAEVVILGIGSALGPILFAYDLHISTLWFYLVLRLFQVIDAHSGYDFPFSLHHFLPFWAGADFHDHHHRNFIGNYATSFRWCDWIFGTDGYYNKWREEQRRKKLKAQ